MLRFQGADLDLQGVVAELVDHRSRKALRLIETRMGDAEGLAILPGTFDAGEIELWLAGDVRPDAPPDMRGFVGVAFALQDPSRFELVFLRPTNGRAADPVRRSHATQYVALPEWPWHRLREEFPGVYESPADLEPGAWTRVRIVVGKDRVELHVHDAPDACLSVARRKGSHAGGRVALWIGTGTIGHFAEIRIHHTRTAG